MRIIPAIDLLDGKCVRLRQGDYQQKKIYNASPLEVARQFEDHGIRYLHLVDLDGAKKHSIVNLKVVEAICSRTRLSVDFGGGIQSDQDLRDAFNAGVTQVTVGSIAVNDPLKVRHWIEKFGSERILLGADVKDREIMIHGWKTATGRQLADFINSYVDMGLTRIVSTDISVDGTLEGPALDLYAYIRELFPNVDLIASGGVGQLSDLDDLKAIGAEGVIIGKAIYENTISLKALSDYVD